jgi:Neuraminidase (sialidase)
MRAVRSGGLTTALILMTASPVFGSWSATDPISHPMGRAVADPGAMAAISDSTIGIVYAEQRTGPFRVMFRRSTDGGSTWHPATRISSASAFAEWPAFSGANGTFDVVWVEEDSNGDHRVWYARSRDEGVTWHARKRLTRDNEDSFLPKVARRGNLVAISWIGQESGNPVRVYTRVSTDGGASFGPRRRLADVTSQTRPAVAIGKNDKIHVVYGHDGLQYQRSGDRGQTWSRPEELSATTGIWVPGLAASGRTIIVAFTRTGVGDDWIVYRRSRNNGFAWEASHALSPRRFRNAFAVALSVRDGRWRAAFARCTARGCPEDSIETLLRVSADRGGHWTDAERVSNTSGAAVPVGATGGTKSVVAWVRQDGFGGISRIYARRES